MLVNNGYYMHVIDKEIKSALDKYLVKKQQEKFVVHKVYYRNQMNDGYRTDEKILKDIIDKNIVVSNENEKLSVVIYYKNTKTKNLVLKNNENTVSRSLDKTNVIYKYKCPDRDCYLKNNFYIGFTNCKLTRRLTMHLQKGAIKTHEHCAHKSKLTREKITENTSILYQRNCSRRLKILEAILIRDLNPSLNEQDSNFARTLKLHN